MMDRELRRELAEKIAVNDLVGFLREEAFWFIHNVDYERETCTALDKCGDRLSVNAVEFITGKSVEDFVSHIEDIINEKIGDIIEVKD